MDNLPKRKLKKIGDTDEKYSIYEVQDADLVAKIKAVPVPQSYEGWKGIWSKIGVAKNGKFIVENTNGDIETVDEKTYNENIADQHIEDINELYDPCQYLNDNYLPIQNFRGMVYSATSKITKQGVGLGGGVTSVRSIYNTSDYWVTDFNVKKFERLLAKQIEDSHYYFGETPDYYFRIEHNRSAFGNGSLYFNTEGHLLNRDYNVDLNGEQDKKKPFEEQVENLLNQLSELPETLLFKDTANYSVWFTNNYAIYYPKWRDKPNPYNKDKIENQPNGYKLTFNLLFRPDINKAAFKDLGYDRIKINLPKKGLTEVTPEHLQSYIKSLVSNLKHYDATEEWLKEVEDYKKQQALEKEAKKLEEAND